MHLEKEHTEEVKRQWIARLPLPPVGYEIVFDATIEKDHLIWQPDESDQWRCKWMPPHELDVGKSLGSIACRYASIKHMVGNCKISIEPGKDADTRSCPDVKAMTRDRLHAASVKHMGDVQKGMAFFASLLGCYANSHDRDKVEDLDGFLSNFHTNFEEKDWLERHYEKNRHHLENPDAVPEDVNLLDVLDHIVDQVMSRKARGFDRPVDLPSDLLQRAVLNTEKMLDDAVEVADDDA